MSHTKNTDYTKCTRFGNFKNHPTRPYFSNI